ncbi:Lipopolysaccharide biosynthesis protein, LPS:glycosyltransferase [Palleronia marisminoris]|uniref:General stress protein A n=1 Tax=Palleronia marisminoris TaxID=315423 RepID=A0A1Y5SYI0_9RHOB|nr:glycosyltransferase family 8 protein [Palleronia marisminoris]SFH06995.1 Lipopolysaccharide biosynthesis protein, LPS:glycosyltransferase [Palleronia marisminoris]SLN51633.1 General stress protein A [Palleronia marisminoris]
MKDHSATQLSVETSRPAGADTAIVFAGDGFYARAAMQVAQQIHALHPDRRFDICIAANDMPASPPESLAHLNLRRCAIRTNGLFDGLRLDSGRTEIVYLRLALPQAFRGEYRRILYLDSDIFVQGGGFGELLTADIAERAIAAVRDNSQARTPRRLPEQFRRLGIPHAGYFNAGVMLIDVSRWLDQDITGRAVAFGRQHRDKMIRHDQNLLNGVLQGDWAELHPTWNWQYTAATNMLAEMVSPRILHFIGPRKPWSKWGGRHPLRYRRAFAEFMVQHFPEQPALPEVAPPDEMWMRRSLAKHILSQHRTLRHIKRFSDEMTVLT